MMPWVCRPVRGSAPDLSTNQRLCFRCIVNIKDLKFEYNYNIKNVWIIKQKTECNSMGLQRKIDSSTVQLCNVVAGALCQGYDSLSSNPAWTKYCSWNAISACYGLSQIKVWILRSAVMVGGGHSMRIYSIHFKYSQTVEEFTVRTQCWDKSLKPPYLKRYYIQCVDNAAAQTALTHPHIYSINNSYIEMRYFE